MIEIVRDDGLRADAPPDRPLIEAARAALAEAGADEPAAMTIRLATDEAVRALNRDFRGKDRVTDVLSFPLGEDGYLGDIALAWPFVADEARRLGLAATAHAQHLVIHGVLHLLGYDHEADDEAAAMQALERRAMRRLGLHDPYPDSAG